MTPAHTTHQEAASLAGGRSLSPQASYWQRKAGAGCPQSTPDASSTGLIPDAEIVIVGGGFAGLSTAIGIMEMQPFARVVVLEANYVGFGASGRSGGLMSPLAAPIWLLTAERNADHAWALRYLNSLVASTAQWLARMVPECEMGTETLALEATGTLTGLGLSTVSDVLAHAGIPHRLSPNPERPGCDHLAMPCHTINPFRAVQGLARHARALGVAIYEGVAVDRIEDTGKGALLTLANGQTINAGTAVVATNASTGAIQMAHQPKAHVVSNYMIATKPLSPQAAARISKSGRFTVELNGAYVYYRLHEGRLLFGGIDKLGSTRGAGYDVPATILRRLERQLQKSFPGLEALEIDEAWGGQYHQTLTDLPIIQRLPRADGRGPGSIVVNVGYGGTGIALTLSMGARVAALALGKPPVESGDERLHEIMCATKLPLIAIARHAGRITLAWTLGTAKPNSLGSEAFLAAMS